MILTSVPTGPDAGEKDVISGDVFQINIEAEEVPPIFVTTTFPVLPDATIAVMLADELILNDCTLIPPTVTELMPLREVPVMVSLVPIVPLSGVNEVMEGSAI